MTEEAGYLQDKPLIEECAEAIGRVQLWSRFNDWTGDHVPGLPVEVCRYGDGDEEDIVVLYRLPAVREEEAVTLEMINLHRTMAIISVLRRRHLLTDQAIEILRKEGM